jgi:transmembrane sensor
MAQDEEAGHWLLKLQEGELTELEKRRFDRWLDNPVNRAAFADIESVWQQLEILHCDKKLGPPANTHKFVDRSAVFRRWGRLAASLMVAGLLSVGSLWVWDESRNTYTSVRGEQSRLSLEDGTIVTLNTDSRIRVRWRSNERIVDLQRGQVLFEVAPDVKRPFRVMTNRLTVTVIGTQFEVDRRKDWLSVAVIEGKVAVATSFGGLAGRTAPLTAGERALLFRDGEAVKVERVAVASIASWRAGLLDFDDTPLAEVIAEFNRYSRVRIVLSPSAPAGQPISGVFKSNDVGAFVSALRQIVPLRSRVLTDGTIELSTSGSR